MSGWKNSDAVGGATNSRLSAPYAMLWMLEVWPSCWRKPLPGFLWEMQRSALVSCVFQAARPHTEMHLLYQTKLCGWNWTALRIPGVHVSCSLLLLQNLIWKHKKQKNVPIFRGCLVVETDFKDWTNGKIDWLSASWKCLTDKNTVDEKSTPEFLSFQRSHSLERSPTLWKRFSSWFSYSQDGGASVEDNMLVTQKDVAPYTSLRFRITKYFRPLFPKLYSRVSGFIPDNRLTLRFRKYLITAAYLQKWWETIILLRSAT